MAKQQVVTCVRHRHVLHPRRHVRRRRHAEQKRAVRWHEKVLHAMRAGRWFAPLSHGLRWGALHLIGRLRCCGPLHHRRCALPGRRGQSCCDWPLRRLRRDSCRHRRSRTDARPSRGHSPSRPTGPCPGRCRCRSTLARNSHRASRRRAHSRSSHIDKPAAHSVPRSTGNRRHLRGGHRCAESNHYFQRQHCLQGWPWPRRQRRRRR